MLVLLFHTHVHVECSVAIVVDHMQTSSSSLTQSKLDIQKRYWPTVVVLLLHSMFDWLLFLHSEQDLHTEQPLQAAALLSLVGAGCLIGCQWYTSVQISSDIMCKYISGKLFTSLPWVLMTHDTVWSLFQQPYSLKQSVLVICIGRRDRKKVAWWRPISMSLCILRMERM